MSIPGYEVLGPRGHSSEATIYQAREISTGRLVRLDVYPAFGAAVPIDEQDRRQQQLEAAALLDHPHLLPVLSTGRHERTLYLVRPFVEGRPLVDVVRAGPVAPLQAAQWGRQVGDAVRHAHEHGIFYLDLGLEDLQVTQQGDILLTSFDVIVVRFLYPPVPRPRTLGVVIGVPALMAPEQARGEPPDTLPGRDVWAVGTLLYYLVVGRPPFHRSSVLDLLQAILTEEAPRPRSLRPDVDPNLETILLRCLRKAPEDRYPDLPRLLADLDAYLAGQPLQGGDHSSLASRMKQWVKGWWAPART
jgi:serine/threonine-protein kinase